ncbi:F-box protein [Cardamine amara subsp. amara]|uniref:F-box protein n=1 Tax=Cardamine amara subsp. amara TaxID=228776 RepID=A0ABD1C955_CARAN
MKTQLQNVHNDHLSIATCRCVSKTWASILGRPDFTELFFSMALVRPKLLFVCQTDSKLVIFSSPQPQNPNENSSLVSPSYHMSFSFNFGTSKICNHVNGLLCLKHLRNRKKSTVLEICNPSTGQSLTLPKVNTSSVKPVRSYLGYDPVEKQYKVLSMSWSYVFEEHQVLTLGTGEPTWRRIECYRPHWSLHKAVCVNGILYYIAAVNSFLTDSMVVCFDVRSEKFRFIQVAETFIRECFGTLVNYNRKLATLVLGKFGFVRAREILELWVLEDADKHNYWSKHTYLSPALWRNMEDEFDLRFCGVTQANEVVMSRSERQQARSVLYVFYYIERKTARRVQIQGMETYVSKVIYIFPNHVEEVKLLQI